MKLYTFGCTSTYKLDAPDRTMRAIVVDADGNALYDQTYPASKASNNFAELWSMAEALRLGIAKANDGEEIEICNDSTTALAWFEGRIGKKVKANRQVIETMVAEIERRRAPVNVKASWSPCEENLASAYVLAN